MARVEIVLTQAYQQIASGPATITLKKVGTGQIFLNDVASDTAAEILGANMTESGQQIVQTGLDNTFARITGENWVVVVDG